MSVSHSVTVRQSGNRVMAPFRAKCEYTVTQGLTTAQTVSVCERLRLDGIPCIYAAIHKVLRQRESHIYFSIVDNLPGVLAPLFPSYKWCHNTINTCLIHWNPVPHLLLSVKSVSSPIINYNLQIKNILASHKLIVRKKNSQWRLTIWTAGLNRFLYGWKL